MLISELIEALQEEQNIHGDIQVRASFGPAWTGYPDLKVTDVGVYYQSDPGETWVNIKLEGNRDG